MNASLWRDSIQQALDARAITVCCLSKPNTGYYLLIDDEDGVYIIEELIAGLKPYHIATTAMSASSYQTISMLNPLL